MPTKVLEKKEKDKTAAKKTKAKKEKKEAETKPPKEAKVEVTKEEKPAEKKPVKKPEAAKPSKPAARQGEPPAKGEARSEERRPEKRDRYFEGVGRRKTAVARVRLYTKPGDFTVNEKLYSLYFSTVALQKIAEDALQKMKLFGRFRVSVKTFGGGIHAQAEAIRHGLARCLVKFNPDFRKRLKRAGFLKRDPRMKERKKPGLKRARRAPQWQKR